MGKWEGGGEDDDGGDGEDWGMGWWDVFVFSGGEKWISCVHMQMDKQCRGTG